MKRGDVVVVRFPHPSGQRGKKRPAVVVQSDAYAHLNSLLIAEVTTNLSMATDPACLLVDHTTPEGTATGLGRDSVISCLILYTVYARDAGLVLGNLSAPMMQKLDNCLKAAFGIR
jgi:mRNA-degrading endonuclease toxin of MazEF toxin-antitoxin module